ncbi:efflux RND transporter periplasmic adaptor subunit [Uliginosibacterium flavum]|uniref:HlyD family efflux transporter periplasmic adaptor subunit n=1 Tax=Uliginosibacterium flavum TaxID=1396831 RepID=A0ABV2TNW3_9RHOO
MTDSLFSPYWYRAAKLHPQLASTTRITRQVFRGEAWYVLSSQTSGRQFRVNHLGYELVGRLDGLRSVQEIWDILVRQLGNDAPSQHEVLSVLSELIAAGMLHSEHTQDLAGIFDASRRHHERTGSRLNPLAFKVPLWDPSALLERLEPLGRRLLTRGMLLVWLISTLLALILTQIHWPELRAYAAQHLTSHSNLMLMWLAYPLVKALHELGHALTIRTWGGAVHEFGITLFLLMPVPYVDASAASAFIEKRRRVLVSAMGVMVELAVASLALLLWLNVSDGWLRELSFAIMSVSSISTLLVNANPLMRFDGYYVLTDALEIPGLSSRADNYLRYLGERWVLGNSQLHPPAGVDGSRVLLLSFGLASLIYRIVLMAGMAIWLGGKQFALGLLLALWLLFRFALRPLWQLSLLVLRGSRLGKTRKRAMLAFGVLMAALLLGTLVVPAPYASHAQGLVWVPDEARVRNEADGFVDSVLVSDGQRVRAGDELLRLRNPDLLASRQQLQTRLASQLQAYQGVLLNQPSAAIGLGEEIDKLRAQIAQFDQRIAALSLRAPLDGRVGLPAAHNLPGRYFNRGSVIAHVINPERMTVRMALAQQDIDLLQSSPSSFTVRIAESRSQSLSASISSQEPGAAWVLPSPLLGDSTGGPFATDPADKDGLRTLEPVFIVDLKINGQSLARIGSRAWIRIEHAPQPLAAQLWRSLRQLFLRQFGSNATGSAT